MSSLAERYHHVRLLLESLNDPYPTPRSALETDPGPAASAYVPCETCLRTGEVRVRSGWMLCLGCDGRGWRRRERDDQPWDAYVNLRLDEAADLPRASAARPARSESADDAYAWERAIQTQDRYGSYAAIRRALDWLSSEHPRRYRLVRFVVVEQQPVGLSVVANAELELGILMITRRVGKVRVPPWLMEQPKRRQTIETMLADGLMPGEIARKLGVSKRVVQRKIRAGEKSRIRAAGVPSLGT